MSSRQVLTGQENEHLHFLSSWGSQKDISKILQRFTSFQAHLSMLIFQVSVLSVTLSGVWRWDEKRNAGMWSSELGRASSSSRGILSVSRQFYIFEHFNQLESKIYNCKNGYHLSISDRTLKTVHDIKQDSQSGPITSEIPKKEFLVPASIYCFNHIKLN